MTSIDDLKHDLKGVSDTVLGNLSTEERLRLFAENAAEGNEEFLEELTETAPEYQYTATDLDYTHGKLKLGVVSLMARNQLYQNYQALDYYAEKRDKHMALMMLNETLARLSGRSFDVDEYGNVDVPDTGDGYNDVGDRFFPGSSYLAAKYQELWEDVPAELLLEEDDREFYHFPALSHPALEGYRSDLSGETFDDIDDDRIDSEVYLTELRLLNTVVDFYINFNGWRLFVEEHLGVSFDEFLNTPIPRWDAERRSSGPLDLDESLCEYTLREYNDYLEAYPSLLKEWGDEELESAEGEVTAVLDMLDSRAQEYADGLAEDTHLPGVLDA